MEATRTQSQVVHHHVHCERIRPTTVNEHRLPCLNFTPNDRNIRPTVISKSWHLYHGNKITETRQQQQIMFVAIRRRFKFPFAARCSDSNKLLLCMVPRQTVPHCGPTENKSTDYTNDLLPMTVWIFQPVKGHKVWLSMNNNHWHADVAQKLHFHNYNH